MQYEYHVFLHNQCITLQPGNYFPSLVFLCQSEVAPYLQGGERGQLVVMEGNRLVLTCPAGGSWPLQYRWTLNNTNITEWTPQYRLVVTYFLSIYFLQSFLTLNIIVTV